MCRAIKNSTPEQKAKYLEGMKKSVPFKAELIAPWLRSGSIVDVGCADAGFTSWLGLKGKTTGIDISPEIIEVAKKDFGLVTDFQVADVRNYNIPSDNVVASSVLHEVYSYGDWFGSVEEALNNIHKNLNKGGRLIIRDFVKPAENPWVRLKHYKKDIVEGHAYHDFNGSGYYEFEDYLLYPSTELSKVYEYIFHKDYHDNWETEIQETYGFWTAEKARQMVEKAGFKIIHYAELDNEWITENRLKGKVEIYRMLDNQIPYPKYQMLLVAEKI